MSTNAFKAYNCDLDESNGQIFELDNRRKFEQHFGDLLDPEIETKLVPCESTPWKKGDLLIMRKDKIHAGPGGNDRALIFFEIVPEGKPLQKSNTQVHGIYAAELIFGTGSEGFLEVIQSHVDYYKKSENYDDNPLKPVLAWEVINPLLKAFKKKIKKKKRKTETI